LALLAVLFLSLLLFPSSASGEWYILKPGKDREGRVEVKEEIEGKKERAESTLKILAPTFTVITPELKKVSSEELLGKPTVIVFVDSFFSPFTEKFAKELEETLSIEDVNLILIDVHDADFLSAREFKEMMKIKKLLITADSYIYEQFGEALGGELSLPFAAVIDSYGFIRFAQPLKKLEPQEAVKRLRELLKKLEEEER